VILTEAVLFADNPNIILFYCDAAGTAGGIAGKSEPEGSHNARKRNRPIRQTSV